MQNFLYRRRLEGTIREGEALLLTERQQNEAASATLAESQARNEALVSKLEDAVKQNDLLRETSQRFVLIPENNVVNSANCSIISNP
jgi:myosin-5